MDSHVFYGLLPVTMESSETKISDMLKWMGLLAWILLYRMAEECHTPESWESLFLSNGLGFRKSNKYILLQHDGTSENSASDLDDGSMTRVKRKRGRKIRKKRKRGFDDELNGDELLDFDDSGNRLNFHTWAGNWLLSIDAYASSWSSMDLPEYLSRHCLSTWIKRAFSDMKYNTQHSYLSTSQVETP
ncbi:hypothetical protein Dimus_032258 [Dionaea muscipula]